LVGFGVEAQKVVPIIDSIQQAVAGIGGDKNDIATFTRAFAQIQSQGRLTGDVLFTLGAKGVDAAKIIGDQMGKSGQQIKDEVTKGTIGADQAIDLLTKGLATKFKGATDNVAKSFIGASDRVTARLRDIGAAITKAFINPLGGGAAVDGLNNIAVGLANIRDKALPGLLPSIQSLADLFVRATEAFKNFTASINADQVSKFLEILKMAAPLAALLGTSLVKSVGGSIPILGTFTRALSGPVLALVSFAATIPEVRESMMNLATSLQPVAVQLLPILVDLLKNVSSIITSLSPLIITLANAFASIAQFVTPIVGALSAIGEKSGILSGILTVLIGRFLLLKLTGAQSITGLVSAFGAFAQAAVVGVGNVIARMRGLEIGAGAAGGGVKNLLGSISGMTIATGIIGGVGALMGVLAARTAEAKSQAQGLVAALIANRDFTNENDRINALKEINLLIEEQKKKIHEVNQRLFNETPSSKKDREAANIKIKALDDQKDRIIQIKEVQDDVLSAVSKQTGETLADVLQRATKAGIDFNSLKFDQGVPTIEKLVTSFGEVAPAAQSAFDKMKAVLIPHLDALDKIRSATDALKGSQRALADLQRVSAQELADNLTRAQMGLQQALESVRGAAERVTLAEIALGAAQRDATQAVETLNRLTKQRNELLADTGREAREVADAQAALAKIDAEMIDQDERRIELQDELARLATEGPDKLAAADRAIERAKIALNTATREENDLLKESNKHQTSQVDLAGLTVAQIKTKLAGVKAEVAAQRSSRGTLKTQEQINDELRTGTLNRLDAEQAYKDAVQGRTDLELSQNVKIREDNEALKALTIDQESSVRRRFEAQQNVSKLLTGDTVTAQTLKDLTNQVEVATDAVKTSAIGVHTAEDGVTTAKEAQKTLTLDIRDREREVETSKFNQSKHYTDIKDAQQKVKEDTQKVAELVAAERGDQDAINAALLSRIGLNSQLLAQNPDLAKQIASTLLGPVLSSGAPGAGGAQLRAQKTTKLTDILQNHPDQLVQFLRENGFQFADGAIVNSATFATIGEAGREVVLPLTRPARMDDLLSNSQVLHPVLAALGRIQLPQARGANVISPTMGAASSRLNIGSGANTVVRRDDGPATYGQMRDVINLLKENGKSTTTITAPITVEQTMDEDALLRKMRRQIERQIYEVLRKR
jgi:tape measure domain-containing protein